MTGRGAQRPWPPSTRMQSRTHRSAGLAKTSQGFEQDVAATQRYFDSPRFDGITRLYTARQVAEQRGTIPADYTVAREAAEAFYPRLRELFAQKQEHHHLRPVLARAGRGHEADGHRGHLPRRLGDLGEGLDQRGSGTRPGQLSAEPGARRGRRAGARAADRRPQSAVPAAADDRRATRQRHRRSTTGRSSSPTPTPATAAIRTCAT